MKSLGLLFGVELLLNTDDEEITKNAERYLKDLTYKAEKLAKLETEKEANEFGYALKAKWLRSKYDK
jgi:hypothetical protein